MGLTCLLVDDSPLIRAMTKEILQDTGLVKEVHEAADGKLGLERLKASADIDLVVSDMQMPEMDGIEMVRAIRADAKLQQLPVIMITSEADQDRYKDACEAGVDGFIPKPFDQETITRKINMVMSARSAE